MNRDTHEMLNRLERVGISSADALQLRRIAMALHRWHERECGEGNDYGSWCVVRGHKTHCQQTRLPPTLKGKGFAYTDSGKPFIEHHSHNSNAPTYTAIPDRERGALKRLADIVARYPDLRSYVQGDPRGASLYILKPGDVPEGGEADSYYNRGVAVY